MRMKADIGEMPSEPRKAKDCQEPPAVRSHGRTLPLLFPREHGPAGT